MYEVAGTTGAFTSTSLIGYFGYNYSAFLSPVLFTLAACTWIWISSLGESQRSEDESKLARVEVEQRGLFMLMVGRVCVLSARLSGTVATSSSPTVASSGSCPATPLRSTDTDTSRTVLLPSYAKSIIGVSSYSQIIVGGSNFGELLGALSVMLFTQAIPTPMPLAASSTPSSSTSSGSCLSSLTRRGCGLVGLEARRCLHAHLVRLGCG
ncbi:hypothetical protein L1887_58860 [Cichorium endivia]|nr:hypothetical protein L1887_58860 [Cichorium endivia]